MADSGDPAKAVLGWSSSWFGWMVSLLLLLCALGSLLLRGHRHRDASNDSSSLSEPLIGKDRTVPTSELYHAGLFGQLAFSWLNPLLRAGRSKALDLGDIPLIAGDDTAHHTSWKSSEAWSRHRRVGSNNLALVLCKCFLGEILLTGFYAFLRTLSI